MASYLEWWREVSSLGPDDRTRPDQTSLQRYQAAPGRRLSVIQGNLDPVCVVNADCAHRAIVTGHVLWANLRKDVLQRANDLRTNSNLCLCEQTIFNMNA